MANSGFQMGRHKVRRLMRQAALKPVWKRKFVHTTDSKHGLPVAANALNRQFNPAGLNLAYVSDITYIRTGAGLLCRWTPLEDFPSYSWAVYQAFDEGEYFHLGQVIGSNEEVFTRLLLRKAMSDFHPLDFSLRPKADCRCPASP